MKNRVFVFLLIAVMAFSALAGCQSVQAAPEALPVATASSAGAAVTSEQAAAPAEAAITAEEAQNIALKHAGFTADQVKRLHVEYEIDRGIPHYDVEFDEGYWEYDYEIDAQTGEILSFEKDD
ncbi:MAG: PepSY domain-containing protein [Oscillospiraceae bacterium]|nr:PepSY domain-containing protein [Oscillospiraceae bacterium]